MQAQLDEFPLDLRPCRVPRAHLRGLPVPADSDARHFPARVGVGYGALFALLDNRVAVAESADARQRGAQPLLETLGFGLIFGALAGWLLRFRVPAPRVQPA